LGRTTLHRCRPFRDAGRSHRHAVRLVLPLPRPGRDPLGVDPADPHGTDDIVSSQLILPVNREVDLTLRAQDVIHGFAVPEMRLKQNAVPGQPTHIHFTPVAVGDYAILCTQLCGMGHYRMNATLRVLSQPAFAAWLAQHEATP
jgi:cytochrome c oxidase subunit 2